MVGELKESWLDSRQAQEAFFFAENLKKLWAPASLPLNILRSSFLGVMRPNHEADHTPVYSSKFRNEWSYTHVSPYALIESIGTTLPLSALSLAEWCHMVG